MGFQAVEIAAPYGVPRQALLRRLQDARLTLVACDLPGDGSDGSGGLPYDPEKVAEFRDHAVRAIDYAAAVGCRLLSCRADNAPPGTSAAAARETLIENLRYAARQSIAAGIRILLEAGNSENLPGAPICGTLQALAVLDAVEARNTGLLYDVTAMRSAGEPVEAMIARNLARIGHVQITGNIARDARAAEFGEFCAYIDRAGHRGWIGCASRASIEASQIWMARDQATRVQYYWGIPAHAFRKAKA